MQDSPKPAAVMAATSILSDIYLSACEGYQTAQDRTPAASELNLEGCRSRVVGTNATFDIQQNLVRRCKEQRALTMKISGFCPVYLNKLNLLVRIGRHKSDGTVSRAINLEKKGPFRRFVNGENLFPNLVPMHALVGYMRVPDGGILAGGCQPVIAHYTNGHFDGAWAIIAPDLPDFGSALESARSGVRPVVRLEQLRESA